MLTVCRVVDMGLGLGGPLKNGTPYASRWSSKILRGIFLENGFGFQRCLNKPTGRHLPARTLFRSAVISFPAEYAMRYLHCREFFSTCR